MQIIIFGAPGVGKGTQAKIISKNYNIKHISTGDMIRDSICKGTKFGLAAKEIVDNGELVSDELMGCLVKETLSNMDYQKGFILDGFPRTIAQSILLDGIFHELGIDNPYFIILNADAEILIGRLTSRRLCKECSTIINLHDLDESNTCPNCGAKDSYIKREDDKTEVVRKRLKIYEETTFPIIDYYKDKYQLAIIDGIGDIDIVADNIAKVLS